MSFSPGDHVVVTTRSLRGLRGTLIRPARLWWNGRRGRVVEVDGEHPFGGMRQAIAESALLPLGSLQED